MVRQRQGFLQLPLCLCCVHRLWKCPREPKGAWKLAESVTGKLTRGFVARRVKCPIAEGRRADHLCWASDESHSWTLGDHG